MQGPCQDRLSVDGGPSLLIESDKCAEDWLDHKKVAQETAGMIANGPSIVVGDYQAHVPFPITN